ncbi:MAG: KfrB domain-containing protein [Duganella sp.]
MNQRVLVMNGQRLLQSERDGKWETTKVDKANQLKPGIYRLDAAQPADKNKVHLGPIVHADSVAVYQQAGQSLLRHEAAAFDCLPQTGAAAQIAYQQGKAHCEQAVRHTRRNIKL